jgi:hypothetical protein
MHVLSHVLRSFSKPSSAVSAISVPTTPSNGFASILSNVCVALHDPGHMQLPEGGRRLGSSIISQTPHLERSQTNSSGVKVGMVSYVYTYSSICTENKRLISCARVFVCDTRRIKDFLLYLPAPLLCLLIMSSRYHYSLEHSSPFLRYKRFNSLT